MSDNLIQFNCLGILFLIRESSLNRFPKTLLGSHFVLLRSRQRFFFLDLGNPQRRASFYNPIRQQYIIDRHITSFEAIVNYYETGKLNPPTIYEARIFFQELKYFQFDEQVIQEFYRTEIKSKSSNQQRLVPHNRILRWIWISLEYDDYSFLTKFVNISNNSTSN